MKRDRKHEHLPPIPNNLARIGAVEFAALFCEDDEAEARAPIRPMLGPARAAAALIALSCRTLVLQMKTRDRAQALARRAT